MVNFNGDKEVWEKLKAHICHNVVIVYYGDSNNHDNISLECEDCSEVLIDVDNPANLEVDRNLVTCLVCGYRYDPEHERNKCPHSDKYI
jgi:hypothetical protein